MIMIGSELVLALHRIGWNDLVAQTICGMYSFREDRSWKSGETPRDAAGIIFSAQVSEYLFHVSRDDMSLRQLANDLELHQQKSEATS